jgi:hypothetical protein
MKLAEAEGFNKWAEGRSDCWRLVAFEVRNPLPACVTGCSRAPTFTMNKNECYTLGWRATRRSRLHSLRWPTG